MTQEFDPKKSYLTVKANEKMIAFTSFLIRLEEDGVTKEGVLKISSFHRPYGGGFLTLTFIADTGQDGLLSNRLEKLCDRLTEDALGQLLGKEFEKIVKVNLDSLEETRWWYTEEVNLYFRSIEGREKILIEEKVIPALENLLPCTFEPVEWWPEGRKTKAPNGKETQTQVSLKGLFNKWFGAS